MALIECPNCKKKVSDTCSVCIHCGHVMQAPQPMAQPMAQPTPQPMMQPTPQPTMQPVPRPAVYPAPQPAAQGNTFARLPDKEKEQLWDAFYAKNPKYAKRLAREADYRGLFDLSTWAVVLFFLPVGVMRFFLDITMIHSEELVVAGFLIGAVMALVGLVGAITFRVLLYRCRRKGLIVLKRFQYWLKAEKGIDYVVKFDNDRRERKRKEYFDRIDLRYEQY